MKGQSVLVSHAIIVGFSVFLVLVVVTTMTGIRDDFSEILGDAEADNVCSIIRVGMEKIYVTSRYESATNYTAGRVTLDLPERIADLPYRGRFEGHNITIEGLEGEFNATCVVGLNASYSGTFSGGLSRISFVRYANGTNAFEVARI